MNDVNGTNWMSKITGHRTLSELNIPGTHDCGTKNVDNSKKLQCQSLSVQEQMNIGVRYFDIRCSAGSEDTTQYIKHSSAFCKNDHGSLLTIDELIETGKTFLKNHPTETLIFQIKNEGNGSNDSRLCNHIGKYIANGSLWAQDRIPCLDEVRGKIVLVRRFTDKQNNYSLPRERLGINLSSWDSECSIKMNCNTFVHVDGKAWVQDRYPVKTDEKLGLLQRAIEEMNDSRKNPSAGWAICLSSCTKPTPFEAAHEINLKLLADNSILNRKKLGTFVVDFASNALIQKIYKTNF